jgi:hypothetical protein
MENKIETEIVKELKIINDQLHSLENWFRWSISIIISILLSILIKVLTL